MENTLFLSALLYLITVRTFTETDAQEKKEIKKARRKAVKDYVNQKIQNATDRKKKLEEDLHIFDGIDVEAQITEATAALEETRKKINQALEESQKILHAVSSHHYGANNVSAGLVFKKPKRMWMTRRRKYRRISESSKSNAMHWNLESKRSSDHRSHSR